MTASTEVGEAATRQGTRVSFERLAAIASHHRRRILLAVAAFVVIAAALAGGVTSHLNQGAGGGTFEDPSSQVVAARTAIESASGFNPDPAVLVLVRTPGRIRSASARAEVSAAARRLQADPAVARVVSYYNTHNPELLSRGGQYTYLVAYFRTISDQQAAAAGKRLEHAFATDRGELVGGPVIANVQVSAQVQRDLTTAETIALPLLFLLSFWVFRGLIAALLPPLIGVVAILGTFLAIRIATEFTSISIFAINLITGLGLGLAIDYSLFIVSRYREELAATGSESLALSRTVQTAGRTVLFSSLTIAAALASLLAFPLPFLYSMGLGGAIVPLVAAGAALLVLPATLAALGPRINALSPARLRRAAERTARPASSGFWYRLSHAVTRHPLPIAILAAAALVVLALPALHTRFTGVDASDLPKSQSARRVNDIMTHDFSTARTAPLYMALKAPAATVIKLDRYAHALQRLPAAAAVSTPQRLRSGLWEINVYSQSAALSRASQRLLNAIRRHPAPGRVLVGGQTAHFVDQQDSIATHLPLALSILATITLALLFAATRSVVLPFKTLLMNALTLGATLGVLVFVFQDGRLERLLGYSSQHALEATQPILIAALAFGLSTDYGIFLLTRIREAYDAGATNREAVSLGLERTGRIVSAAALLFCVAIGAFATSKIVFIKEVGIGGAVAVIIDATIVRALLVPSLMQLLGAANWWAPGRWRSIRICATAPARREARPAPSQRTT
jgi:uncharacterized membrane protein YdfJ with MMPL/SSD domain